MLSVAWTGSLSSQYWQYLVTVLCAVSIFQAPKAGPTGGDLHDLRWLRVPAGTFQMGCLSSDPQCFFLDEKVRHEVMLTKTFELMTTEATVGMFKVYAAATKRALPAPPGCTCRSV